ncbi:MAG: hypothetical protein ACM3SM_13395 [Bacteroidota bacterium]
MKPIEEKQLEELQGGSKVCDFIAGMSTGYAILAWFGAAAHPGVGLILAGGAVGCWLGWW